MTVRAYLSNINRLLPIEAQEALHAAGTPGWPRVTTYRDELGRGARKAHSAETLVERANLLRPTSRRASDEVMYVAALGVLAWTAEDFMGCMAAASARHAAVVALDTGRRIEPTAGAAELREALAEFLAFRRKEQTGAARKAAALTQAAKRQADVAERLKLIADDWPLRTVETAELLLRAGRTPKGRKQVVPMSYVTAAQHLGPRPLAQKRREVAIERGQRRKMK